MSHYQPSQHADGSYYLGLEPNESLEDLMDLARFLPENRRLAFEALISELDQIAIEQNEIAAASVAAGKSRAAA